MEVHMKMSQTLNKLKQIASKFNHNKRKHKPGESTSSRPGWMVRDSHLTIGGLRMTNTTAGTFTGLIALLVISVCFCDNTYATASTISISITNAGNLTINVPPTTEGKFASGDAATVSITTNHAVGYNLTVKANSSTDLVGTGSNTNVISSLPTGTSISADTFANDSTYNNMWGYKPQKYNSSTNSTFRPSPSVSGDTIDSTSNADNNSYTVSIGAKVTTATPLDSYSNTFIFAVTGKVTPYAITYNQNTTDTVTNMPANHTTSDTGASGETVTIDSTVPVRDGYNFKGWCSTTTSDETCSGTTYNPDGDGTNLTLTINQTSSSNSYTLYAMWESADPCIGSNALYCKVATQLKTNSTACTVKTADNKCSQDAAGLKAVITTPTSSDPSTDTSNSGVFAYNSSVFGEASDASNDNTIYYFRGILDSNIDPTSSASPNYGSNGDSAYYQNYVRLGNTCWRIVRTTGSGGVKMIYNGSYSGGTTANSCANATGNAQLTTAPFNTSSATVAGTTYTGLEYQNMHAVGYTYSNVAASTTTNTALSTLLGSSGNDTTTNTNSSIIKKYIEIGWYQQNMTNYTSLLEPNAGYCNDRTVFDNTSPYTQQAESTNVIPYGTSGMTQYNFGAYVRNKVANGTRTLTLSCPRGAVDLYSTTTTSGGNGQLTYPVALITVDEAALSGSGGNGRTSTATQSSNYSYGSFLRSGSYFWLLSPRDRYTYGGAGEFLLSTNGSLYGSYVSSAYGVRPSISLTSGTTATSGSGTAADPWVVLAP